MINTSDFIVAGRNLFPVIEEMLEDGKSVRLTVSGNSMWPLIINNRDSVLLVPRGNTRLKKGEIILFRTSISHYVLHRITKVKKVAILQPETEICTGMALWRSQMSGQKRLLYIEKTVLLIAINGIGKWYFTVGWQHFLCGIF